MATLHHDEVDASIPAMPQALQCQKHHHGTVSYPFPRKVRFVCLCLQSSILHATGKRLSQYEKHMFVSLRNNFPQKGSTVPSDSKFGAPAPPQKQINK